MVTERRAPATWRVIYAIARREIALARRRRLVRLLFLASLLPPIVLATVLVVRLMTETVTGVDLGWDPVLLLLRVQAFPVSLLALGLGTPSVARDRAEDVLFLYATRPVSPWSYALGKMLAVAVPAAALLFLPGLLIAVIRQGVIGSDVTTIESLSIVAKVAVAAAFAAAGFSGVSVGPSAATRRARWALVIALAFFIVPDGFAESIWGSDAFALGPGNAVAGVLDSLFDRGFETKGLLAALLLLAYGTAGLLVTATRVGREMTP